MSAIKPRAVSAPRTRARRRGKGSAGSNGSSGGPAAKHYLASTAASRARESNDAAVVNGKRRPVGARKQQGRNSNRASNSNVAAGSEGEQSPAAVHEMPSVELAFTTRRVHEFGEEVAPAMSMAYEGAGEVEGEDDAVGDDVAMPGGATMAELDMSAMSLGSLGSSSGGNDEDATAVWMHSPPAVEIGPVARGAAATTSTGYGAMMHETPRFMLQRSQLAI